MLDEPTAGDLPLKVVQSVELKAPRVEPFAVAIVIAGAVVPVTLIAPLPVTLVTVPELAVDHTGAPAPELVSTCPAAPTPVLTIFDPSAYSTDPLVTDRDALFVPP